MWDSWSDVMHMVTGCYIILYYKIIILWEIPFLLDVSLWLHIYMLYYIVKNFTNSLKTSTKTSTNTENRYKETHNPQSDTKHSYRPPQWNTKSSQRHKTSTMTHTISTNLHKYTIPAQRDKKLPLLFFLILQVTDSWKDESPRRTRRAKQRQRAATGAWRESVSIFHLYFTRRIKHGWYICRVLMVTVRFSRMRAESSWKCGQRNRLLRTSWTTVSWTESWFPVISVLFNDMLSGKCSAQDRKALQRVIHPSTERQWQRWGVCSELKENWKD